MSESLIFAHFLFFGERCEWIAHFAQIKWAMWANRSGRSPKMSEWVNRSFFWANRSFAHFWAKNKRIARKTGEQIPSPARDPILVLGRYCHEFSIYNLFPSNALCSYDNPYYLLCLLVNIMSGTKKYLAFYEVTDHTCEASMQVLAQ